MRRTASALLAGAVALGLLAACGRGDDELSASGSTTTTTTVRATTTTAAPTTTTEVKPVGPPEVPDDPAALAAVLADAERAIRDPDRPTASLATTAHTQQVAYRKLVDRPELREPTLAALPPDLRATAAANIDAGAKLRSMITKPRETLPAWRIETPPPAEELESYYREAATAIGVQWEYLASINLVETRMGRIRGTSSAGAQGPMQFMPATWGQYGEGGDVNNPRDAIFGAARLLKRNGAPGDWDNALFNYNRDVRYVSAVKTYAEQMVLDPAAYRGYYHWQVYYVTVNGDVWLPEGWVGEGAG